MSYLSKNKALSISIDSLKAYSHQHPELSELSELKQKLKAQKHQDKAVYQTLKRKSVANS